MLETPLPAERIPGFAEGLVSVQDAAAQLAAPLLDARRRAARARCLRGARAARPTHILELADVELTALDSDAARLERVRGESRAAAASRRSVVCGDAGEPAAWWDGGPYDRILADVPCTASGVVRRHPDIKWLRRAERHRAVRARAARACSTRCGRLLAQRW